MHELYRFIFEKSKALKEKEEEDKRRAEEEEEKRLAEEREAKRNNVPLLFAANKSRNTPPSKQDEVTKAAQNVTVEDLEDFIEEVTS